MGMTMTQKILAAHAGVPAVETGQLVEAEVDLALANDITAPVALNELEKAGLGVVCPGKIALVMDHFTPNKDIRTACGVKRVREFAAREHIEAFFDVGEAGIEHALLPEKGLVTAGDCVIGADSHTCTYGAIGAFATGVGSTDFAAAMATGKAWFKVPAAVRVVLKGALPPFVTGKDLILHLIGRIGVDGALYESLEFSGDVGALSVDERFTVCNMAIEAGAKNGIFPVDETALSYLLGRAKRVPRIFEADADAVYEREVEIDLNALEPTVSFPHSPENTRTEWETIPIEQVVIGSCTNGRISDLRQAAEVLRGRHVARGVRVIVIPATQDIYLEAVKEGLVEIFVRAGAVVSAPTCGPCLGGHMGILADGERCVSTTNRNFVGRMGHVSSEVYLASPYTAAASAVLGRLATAKELL